MLASAEPLNQGQRDRAMSILHSSQKLFLDSLAGLSDAQWSFKPDDTTWSIAECAEHIAVSEETIFGLVGKIMAQPVAPDKKALTPDETLIKLVTDRSQKAQAPEFLKPTHRWPTREALVSHFRQKRAGTISYVETTKDELRSHFGPHPLLKELDAYQWILLIAAHSERHTLQINEVKTHAKYPK